MPETLVVIPTYNEKESISNLAHAILNLGLGLDILIVDDNSPDGTGKIGNSLSQRYRNIKILHRSAKLGLGTAYLAGFKYALNNGYKYVITMDSDFSHDPSYIPQLLKFKDKFDIVIGSRYVAGGGVRNWSIGRKMISLTANLSAKLMLGLKNNDCTAGFRLYTSDVLQHKGILEGFFSNGYSFLIEMLFRCKQKGYKAMEIPIIFNDRRVGVSKISRMEIIRAVQTLFKFAWIRILRKNEFTNH